MRPEMNLATHPFGQSRLFWLLSGLTTLALTALAVWLGSQFLSARSMPPEMLQTQQRLQQQLQELAAEEAQLRAELNAPATIDIYDRSHFLNQLLTRKGVSWTRTFEDIEEVLPPRVLMMQIRPEVTYDNDVALEMQVGAEAVEDFIELLSSLESSDKFGPPNVRGYNPPNENEPYHRFQLTVSYAQQL